MRMTDIRTLYAAVCAGFAVRGKRRVQLTHGTKCADLCICR